MANFGQVYPPFKEAGRGGWSNYANVCDELNVLSGKKVIKFSLTSLHPIISFPEFDTRTNTFPRLLSEKDSNFSQIKGDSGCLETKSTHQEIVELVGEKFILMHFDVLGT